MFACMCVLQICYSLLPCLSALVSVYVASVVYMLWILMLPLLLVNTD